MMLQAPCDPASHAPAPRYVFVYGTLRAGGSNDIARFSPAPERIGEGEIAGTLYDLGAYPGARLDGAGRVRGEIYRIVPALEVQLDRLEEVLPNDEGEYRKRELRIDVGHESLNCLVYEIQLDRCAGKRVIKSGDWFQRG
ncbi:gamma-glutamylcyclotransferase family protein [Variovorax sp. J22R133]|uniref:gamma-glutamylcyclotransferase family protein n=1 Tax=Variovorax brevis TaxID=3053503 RepID=UPI0025777B01|nr:gamma-glutamylcyclotransferase family protein [Variovorax sp. J22R133]MDM0111961.1 gamma-glutamylcyclotransferase family protein [Variovorax sp. J22R133]